MRSWQRALIPVHAQLPCEPARVHGNLPAIYGSFADVLRGQAQLPKFADNIYRDAERTILCWLGTAEIALTNLHRDEILDEEQLPDKLCGLHALVSGREKMSAGRDVRGIKRGHQF